MPVLSGLRKVEDGWVFEDPVTEEIAPGYFEVIDEPMDLSTVEKKLEASEYKHKDEVCGGGGGEREVGTSVRKEGREGERENCEGEFVGVRENM